MNKINPGYDLCCLLTGYFSTAHGIRGTLTRREQMAVKQYTDVLPVVMNNDVVKNVAGRVMIGKEDGAENFCMRVFEMAKDGHTPKHAHDWEHEIFVHTGHGEVLMNNTWHPLSPGSTVFVPPNAEHQFRNRNDSLFTFVCLIPSGVAEL